MITFLTELMKKQSLRQQCCMNSLIMQCGESEPVPFDPMEITLHKVYEQNRKPDQRKDYQLFHEYPLEGKPPMMTHLLKMSKRQNYSS